MTTNYYHLIYAAPDEKGEWHSLDMCGEYAASTPEEAARKALLEIEEQCGDGCSLDGSARIEHQDPDGGLIESWSVQELLEDDDELRQDAVVYSPT
jgi:hypothetical protein